MQMAHYKLTIIIIIKYITSSALLKVSSASIYQSAMLSLFAWTS